MKVFYKLSTLWQHYFKEIKTCINDLKTPGRRKKQIPNMLTSSRIVAPFIIVPLSFLGFNEVALVVTALAASTDFFDGVLARKLDAKSEFGKELDPVSDKVFASGLLISLSTFNPLILINLGLELGIATTNFISKLKDNNPQTHFLGKVKTWSLSAFVILNYLAMYIPISNIVNLSLFSITTILQTGSVVKYIAEDNKKDKLKDNKIMIEKKFSPINKTEDIVSVKEKSKTLKDDLKTYKNVLENSNRQTEDYGKSLHL